MKKRSDPSAVYDIIKFITVLLVVIAHSTRMYTASGAFHPANASAILAKLTNYIYIFHMPLFMFVSGAVYGLCIQKGKYAKPLPFVGNKAKRLLIPYLAFGLLYVTPVMCYTGLAKHYSTYIYYGILLSLNSRHLWFLLALFIIFIFAILARKWLLRSHYTRLGVMILSCIAFALADRAPDQLQLRAALQYQLYFMLGATFHFVYEQAAAVLVKCKYLLVVLPVALLGSFYCNPNRLTSLAYQLAGILMLVMLAVLLEQGTALRETKFFQYTKDTSMGIFLFHPMIIYLAYYFLGSKNIPPAVLSAGVAIVSFYASILLTKLLRRLRLGLLLGE